MKCVIYITVILLLCFSLSVSSHTRLQSGLTHYCSKPFKPYRFNSEWEVIAFNNEVDSYRICIRAFVSEQEEAIKIHKRAAQEAIDEWNNFVNYEMN